MKRHGKINIYFVIGIVFLAVGIAYLLFERYILRVYVPNIGCLFYRLTGLYCPGCGGTRAVYSLLTGHVLKAFWYHPVVPVGAILYVCFMFTNLCSFFTDKIKALEFKEWYLWLILILVVFNFVIKNILLLVFHITI